MSHVAWSVCLCVGHMGELCNKSATAEPIEILFEGEEPSIRWNPYPDGKGAHMIGVMCLR